MAALAGITIKVMPESVEVNLGDIKDKSKKLVEETYGEVREIKFEEVPIAFGLKALNVIFIVEETLGSDIIQEKIAEIEGVASATCTGFQRLT